MKGHERTQEEIEQSCIDKYTGKTGCIYVTGALRRVWSM